MGYRRTLAALLCGKLSVGVCLVALSACAMLPPNSFLDPTKIGQFPWEAQESGIRRVLTPRDTPPGLASATEPTPEDLIAIADEYRLRPGDGVQVAINSLLTAGEDFRVVVEVGSKGEIRIPDLGSIRVAGLTEQELEQELTARLKEAGILPRPIVQVLTQVKRGRTYTMLGAVGGAGVYPIPSSDTRLLDAIGAAGDIAAVSKRAYVIRREAAKPPEAPPPQAPPTPNPPNELVIPPPAEEPAPSGGFMTKVGLARQDESTSAPSPPPTQKELDEIISPTAPRTSPATRAAERPPRPPFEPLIFDPVTGQVLQAPPETAPSLPAPTAAPLPPKKPAAVDTPEQRKLEEPFDWESVAESEFEQRVIAIDVTELKNGNPRYNIVLRDRDVINVPADTGVFYIMGEVNRPGVFAFGGRDITIKQAIAVTGGFSQLAWPQRCEVIRREPGTDKQLTIPVNLDAVFAGLEEDFYLRDDDIVNVGSHFVAPFLFVIRNSFRFTYGFGFVYDRNFGDQDAVGGRPNPRTVQEQKKAQRGLPF